MNIEEFIQLGCLQCGHHNFISPGPILQGGPTFIRCNDCGTDYTQERIGELDSIDWERDRAVITGEAFEEPRTTRYHNEEQFIDRFTESTDNGSSD